MLIPKLLKNLLDSQKLSFFVGCDSEKRKFFDDKILFRCYANIGNNVDFILEYRPKLSNGVFHFKLKTLANI